jgi:hypothetical protein
VVSRASAWAPRLSTVPSIYDLSPSYLLVFIHKIHTSLCFLLLMWL